MWDHTATLIAFMGLAMPSFWLGVLLILIFGVWLGLLPVFGYMPMVDKDGVHFWAWFSRLILPAIATGSGAAAILSPQTLSASLETFYQYYIPTSYPKWVAHPLVS